MADLTTLNETTRTLDYTEYVRLATSGANWKTQLSSILRPRLTADITYYVNSGSGSDSNDGLTSGTPFATIQKAINVLTVTDMLTYNATVSVAAGTYTEAVAVTGPWNGSGTVTISGDTTTPSNCLMNMTSNNFNIQALKGARLSVQGIKFTNSGAGGSSALHAESAARLDVSGKCEFGACTFAALSADPGGTVWMDSANSLVSGGGFCFAYASRLSTITVANGTLTLSNTPAFSGAFMYIDNMSALIATGMTFPGSGATGSRFNVADGSLIQTSGSAPTTYFPGNSAGTGTNYSASPWGLYI